MNQWGFYPLNGFATIKATKTCTGFEIIHVGEDIGEILSRRIGDLLGEMEKISKLLDDDPQIRQYGCYDHRLFPEQEKIQMTKFLPLMKYAPFNGYHLEEDTIVPVSRLSELSRRRFNEVILPSVDILLCEKAQMNGVLTLPTNNLFSSSHNETTISKRFKETNKFQQTRKQNKNQNKNTKIKGRPNINRINSGR
jgi:hypothetical protein